MFSVIEKALFSSAEADGSGISEEVLRQMKVHAIQTLPLDRMTLEQKLEAAPYLVRNLQILHEQTQVLQLLKEQEIPVIVLKGFSVAVYYPNPLYRICGDIDLWVDPERYDEACSLLKANGYSFREENNEKHLKRDKMEKHTEFFIHGIEIELHMYPFRVVSFAGETMEKDLFSFMKQGLDHSESAVIENTSCPVLPPIQNAVELLVHTQQHIQSDGIGLRQIIDWMMFVNQEMKDTSVDPCLNILKQFGLYEFACILTRMCQLYLGLPEKDFCWAMHADETVCRTLMTSILKSGNFGRNQKKNRGASFFKQKSLRVRLLRLQRGGELNYANRFHIHPWMKKFAWMFQLRDYVVYVLKNQKKLKKDYQEGQRRKNLINSLHLFETDKTPGKGKTE